MTQIRIDFISGASFPVQVFIADVYGNNQALIGTITSTVPPEVDFNSTIPPIFNTAPAVMVKIVDANGCEIFKILECTFGCAFEITVNLVDCVVDISLSVESCEFTVTTSEESCTFCLMP